MEVVATANATCEHVASEIKARVSSQGNGTWHDPHNRGTYSIDSYAPGSIALRRVTGDKKYTDKMIFSLSPSGNMCTIQGCSRSQVNSYLDYGTNYCNLRMMYCGAADACKPVMYDFTSVETSVKPHAGATHKMSD